jgi:ankyrin repeat protein
MLLDTAVNVDAKDNNDRVTLSWAAERGRDTIAKMLLDTGKIDVDIDVTDERSHICTSQEKTSH